MKTQEEIKTPFVLTSKLDYRNGDVAAKDLLANDSGSIRFLAFDANAMIAHHAVKSDVLVYVVEGSVEFEVDDVRHKLDKGDAMILPSETPHTVLALEKSKVLLSRLNA